MKDSLQRPCFSAALRFWCKLGWITFGGTAAHIAIMHDELVEKKRWISNRSFLHALSHCMILPGPEAQQLAIYIGWKLHGKRGGIVAGILFVLPSMFILLALSVIYVRFGSLPWITAMFNGLKPVVIALVIVALQRVARKAVRGPIQGAVAVATFAAMFFFEASLVIVMFSAIALGIALTAVWPGLLHHPGKASAEEDKEEESYYIRSTSAAMKPISLSWPTVKLTAVILLLWLLPLPLFYFFVGAAVVERTQDNPRIGGVLELITAVVVGAILDLTLFLGKGVIFPSGVAGLKQLNVISLSGVILSLLLLHRFKLKVIPLILLGVGFGLIRYFLGF